MIRMKLLNRQQTFKDLKLELEKRARRHHTLLATQLVERLKTETPVDTGEARDGWLLERRSASAITVVNEVPHIVNLNEGSSPQAEANFVERTALQFGKPYGLLVDVE